MNRFLKYIALAAVAAGLTVTAHALPTLSISDGVNTTIVADGGAGDLSPAGDGVVAWFGSVGVWNINVDTGLTKPAQGNALNPYMDLNFVDASTAGGTLTLMFSEVDFGPGSGTSSALIGGTTAGTVTYSTWWDPANGLFAQTNMLTMQGPFGPGAYSGAMVGGAVISPSSPYSLTQVVTIVHSGIANSSGDAELTIPDNGASIMLLGAGLTVLALFGRARKLV